MIPRDHSRDHRHHRFPILIVVAVAALVLVLVAAPAAAGPRDHADGFFLRLAAGMGGAKSSIDLPDGSMEISGAAADVNIAIGGMVAPNFAVHGTLFGWTAAEPDVDFMGESATLDGDVTAAGFGVGATWYFMPANVYVSGSVGIGSLEVDFGNAKGETDNGPLLDLSVGKEWWVGDKWGLGVGAGVQYHRFPDGDVDENWSGATYCLRFTATMN